jgi:pyruvate dehydrogenase E1 component alpha subunit
MTNELPATLDPFRTYRAMRLIRTFEEQLHAAIARGGVPGFTHLYAGEEASAVGVCLNLRDDDVLCSTHRAHGHFLAKGGDLDALALEVFGKQGGACKGKGGTMHVADWRVGMWGANSIVGASAPHALGAAFAARYRSERRVAVSFGGDGASNQGATFECWNLAKVLELPVVFVLEDNGYAETTAASWSVAGRPVERAAAFGIPAEEVDGSDVVAVYTRIGAGIERARAAGGPQFFHLRVPLFYGHYEGDPETYRAPGEVERLRAEADCIAIFRARLLGDFVTSADALDAIDREVAADVEQALAAAAAAPPPLAGELLTDVWADVSAGAEP